MDFVDVTALGSEFLAPRTGKSDKARGMKRKAAEVPKQKKAGEKAVERKTSGKKNDRKRKKRRGGEDDKHSVIYLGHVPHGFYEDEMTSFFSQFGDVLKVKLARSKKTGKSRGFAFIKFRYAEVARVVADTMNNYLLSDKLLKCHVLPPDKVHHTLFSDPTAGVRSKEEALLKHDESKLPDDVDIRRVRTWNRLVAKKNELGKIGIDLKELDVLDTTEKSSAEVFDTDKEREVEIMEEEEEAGVNQTAERFKKKSTKRASKEKQEEKEEEAVRFALSNMPGCKKLMEQLGQLSAERFVVNEDEIEAEEKEESGEGVSFDEDVSGSDITDDEVDEDDEAGEDISDDEDEEEDLNETAVSGAGGYDGHEVRLYGDSDSEIEFKTPPGMKKRKMKVAGDFVAVESDEDESSDDEEAGDDEGFEEKKLQKTPTKATPRRTPKLNAKTPSKSPRYHDAVASTGKKSKQQEKLEKTPIQIFSSGKKKQKKVNSEAKKADQRRQDKERRRSAPAGTALASKKFKSTAFLDRSLGRRRVSKRADEMDDD